MTTTINNIIIPSINIIMIFYHLSLHHSLAAAILSVATVFQSSTFLL